MDMLEVLTVAVLGFSMSTLSLIACIYYVKTKGLLEETIENVILNIQNDPELQQALYQIGGLVGNGAKIGFGMQQKTGKFRWQDMVVELAGQFIGSKIQNTVTDAIAPALPTPTQNTPKGNDYIRIK